MSDTGSKEIKDIVMDVLYERRSVRKFTDEPISEEDFKYILEAARWAPSGENSQGWRFIIIKDRHIIETLGKICGEADARMFTGEYVTKRMHERFATMQDEEKKRAIFKKLTSGSVSRFVATAPYVIAVVGNLDVLDVQLDNAAAIENMLVMISALKLGACWVVSPLTDIRDDRKVQKLLKVGSGYKVVSIIALGHMEKLPKPRPRLELKDIAFENTFGNPYFKD
jgi:nitroreductase